MTSEMLIRHPRNYSSRGAIRSLLIRLGMPRSALPKSGFWNRSHGEMEVLLNHAKEIYDARIVEVHPDRGQHPLRVSQDLNELWGKIKNRFKSHLNPRPISERLPSPRISEIIPVPDGWIRQLCQCGCGGVFLRRSRCLKKFFDVKHKEKARGVRRRSAPLALIRCGWHRCRVRFRPNKSNQKFCSRRCYRNDSGRRWRERHPEATQIYHVRYLSKLSEAELRSRNGCRWLGGRPVTYQAWLASRSPAQRRRIARRDAIRHKLAWKRIGGWRAWYDALSPEQKAEHLRKHRIYNSRYRAQLALN